MKTPLPPGPPLRATIKAEVNTWASYVERIDVRSPGEFAEDHLPDAINLPVLDDAERARVGTMYVQQSAFDARKIGAAIVSRNIAAICDSYARDKPREWSPLVYCWRGGQRSRALVHVLTEIGFRALQLDGGYRAYRRHVVDMLRLARHRGSLLGDLPDDPQPSQKMFESALYAAMSAFDVSRPVFVESESQRIGRLQVPESLLVEMRESPCIRLDTSQALRVALLEADYAHLVANHAQLHARLAPLAKLHGNATMPLWTDGAQAGAPAELAADLLATHYDPLYKRAIHRNFRRYRDALVLTPDDGSHATFQRLARELLAESSAPAAARPA